MSRWVRILRITKSGASRTCMPTRVCRTRSQASLRKCHSAKHHYRNRPIMGVVHEYMKDGVSTTQVHIGSSLIFVMVGEEALNS